MKKENRDKIDVFNLGQAGGCSRRQLLKIRDKFIAKIEQDTCLQCCQCHKMLSRVIFVYHEGSSYCAACFQATPQKRVQAFVFADLDLKDPLLDKWKLNQELELLHLTHELGVEDTQLLAKSMTIPQIPKTPIDIQQFYESIHAACPLPSGKENQVKREAGQQSSLRNEQWFEIYNQFREQLEDADIDIMNHILGELHERSDSKEKQFMLQQFKIMSDQRAKMFGKIERLAKKYPQRHKHPQIFFPSSSDSLSCSDLSIKSDSKEFEEFKHQSQMLLQQIDTYLKRYSKEQQKMPKQSSKTKRVTFLEDILEDGENSSQMSAKFGPKKAIKDACKRKVIKKSGPQQKKPANGLLKNARRTRSSNKLDQND